MAINSEAIYATRPWKIFGTGPQSMVTKNEKEVNAAQQFNERNRKEFTYEDIRFTTKGKNLYAFFMGWPNNGLLTIKALGTGSEQKIGRIEAIELLGGGKLDFTIDEVGLHLNLPSQKPGQHAYAIKLSGIDLV